MPAVAVQRTDTFESQRVKINQIGQQIFSITEGGSDLSTGNLKLGDGTIQSPSLAFDNDNLLGLYRPSSGILGFVSSGKRVQNLSNLKVEVLQDFQLTQNRLQTAGISILNAGSGYEVGDYTSIPLTGGSGRSAEAAISVLPYNFTVSNLGSGYNPGSFAAIRLQGGNGSAADIDFVVNGLSTGTLVAGGGYVVSSTFPNVSLTTVSGSGSGAIADIITDAGGAVIEVVFTDEGNGYVNGDVLSANANFDGVGSGSGFSWTLTSDPGIITNIALSQYGNGFQTGDVLTLPQTQTGITTNLRGQVQGLAVTLALANQVTLTSTAGIVAGMVISQQAGDTGQLAAETTVASVDNATQITLSATPTVAGAATLDFVSIGQLTEFEVADSSIIFVGDIVTQTAGTGVLAAASTVTASANNIIQISAAPTTAGTATLSFTPAFGDPADDFELTIGNLGIVDSIQISEGGTGYEEGNTLSVDPEDVVQPIQYSVLRKTLFEVTFSGTVPVSWGAAGDTISTVPTEGAVTSFDIIKVYSSGGNIDKIVFDSAQGSIAVADVLENAATTQITVATVTSPFDRFFINTGSSLDMTPDLTLYAGSTYEFDVSDPSMSTETLAFTQFRDGKYSPSLIENLSATLDVATNQVSVTNATGILVGMIVTTGIGGTGTLVTGTTVTNVVGNTITLSRNPLSSGSATLSFAGVEYNTGVTRTTTTLTIKVSADTPTLYYYSRENVDLGGADNQEATITIDLNNPATFGSGLSISVVLIDTFAGITGNILTGAFNAVGVTATDGLFDNLTVNAVLTANNIASTNISADSITSVSPNLALNATNINLNLTGSVDIGPGQLSIDGTNGNLTAQGIIKTADSINVNDKLTITNAVIASGATTDIELTPAVGQDVKINSTKSLIVPVGTDLQRPASPVAGAIRFNSDTSQYEGYASNTSSWSSLGGVRDLDGNTYILAEETVGANDNTLYFYNDSQNTIRITPFYQEFVNVKKVRSVNVSAPAHTNWNANSPVVTDDYVKYGNNLFLVVSGGQTGTDANPPTDTTGSDFTNGTATLRYSTTAVAPLTFEEIEEFRIAPLGGTDLAINGDLRLKDNIITTDVNDLSLSPLPGKKVVCDIKTTLVVPVGTTAERGSPAQGSVRFNTSDSLFEGYDGVNWGSLGGVKDVDQNTYIIPETSPGANENILYFYNDGNNTLRLTATQLEFDTVDTIVSVTSDELEITASLMTFDAAATTLDNTLADTTFLHSAKQYFDLGLSSGLYVEPVLRLDNQGDVYFNTTFGTGAYNGVKVFDGELKEFELADTKILTDKFNLVKGTNNVGTSVIYNNTSAVGAKTIVCAENPTTGDSEFIEFGLLDDGTDVWHTEYGNVRTGQQLIVPTFDLSGTNDVRITITLGDAVGVTQTVKVTITNNITKK
tara:strand:+ start:4153 stop:8391 length:4239 start_codon:yes stop_codon:yes gene_type:complete